MLLLSAYLIVLFKEKKISILCLFRPLSVDYAAKLRNSYMSPSSVSSGGEFDGSKESEHHLGIHPSSPPSLATRLGSHAINRKRSHLVDDDLMDGDNSSDILPVVPSRRRSCSRDRGVDDIAVPEDDDDDIRETGNTYV